LAFTPLGVPVTWITGPAGGRELAVLRGWLGGAVADLMAAGCEVVLAFVDVQAARAAAMTATTATQTSRALRGIMPAR
jgi:hypothetical protein